MDTNTDTKEDVVPFETICNNHNHIIWMLKQYKKTGNNWYIDQSIKLTRYCKKQGQKLENRAALYRRAIEACGFKRVYKATDVKSWQK